MLIQTKVGPPATSSMSPGTMPEARAGQLGDAIVSGLQPKYYENTYRENAFYAANQAAQAISVALTTTYTGLVVQNPIGNNKNLVLTKVGLALSVAPAAIATIGLFGASSTANITHTTPLTPASLFLGKNNAPTAKADSAATIVGTPVWLMQLSHGFTAGALPGGPPSLIDIDGAIVISPGSYVCIGALTAVTGLWSMAWIEVPV